jgi:hypothetical protein
VNIQRCWNWRWIPTFGAAWKVTVFHKFYGLSWRWGFWNGAIYFIRREVRKVI